MGKAIIDNWTKEQLEQFVKDSTNMNQVLDKVGYTIRGRNQDIVKQRLDEYNIDYSHFTLSGITPNKRTYENVFCEGSTASQHTLRNWYIKENTNYICSICGQPPIWNNQPLTLILDHINGTHNDNRIENLRWGEYTLYKKIGNNNEWFWDDEHMENPEGDKAFLKLLLNDFATQIEVK